MGSELSCYIASLDLLALFPCHYFSTGSFEQIFLTCFQAPSTPMVNRIDFANILERTYPALQTSRPVAHHLARFDAMLLDHHTPFEPNWNYDYTMDSVTIRSIEL